MTGVPPAVADAADVANARPTVAPVVALTFVLATCSILYELIAAQTLSLLAADTVVWYSLVVGVFLASMGIGAFRSRRIERGDEWRALLRIEIALTVAGFLIVTLLRLGHTAYTHLELQSSGDTGIFVFLAVAAVSVCTIGVLTGLELPLLMRIARTVRDESRSANVVLGVDYVGSLAGALLFSLVILPNMSVLAAGLAVASVNLVAAAWILESRSNARPRRWETAFVWVSAAAILAGIANADRVEQFLLRRYYYRVLLGTSWKERFTPRPDLPRVARARSSYQEIDLLTDVAPNFMSALMPAYSHKLERDPGYPVDHVLFLNGDFQTSTRFDEVYHEWFAHVPVVASGKVPRRVLLLGGGDGLLLRELLKYDGVEHVRHVDLDPVLVTLGKTDPVLRRANGDSFRDPRVETTFEDGFQFVRRTKQQFDAVYIDFPVATNFDLAKLYSREFFDFVRRRIAPGGYAVFDSTGTSLLTEPNERGERWATPDNDWPVYYATLRAAGYPKIIPYLTTLESDNVAARKILEQFKLDDTVLAELATIEDPDEREKRRTELRASAIEQFLHFFSVQLEQGFILLFPEDRQPAAEFTDPGVALDVLNADRYARAFGVQLAQPAEIDPDLVNSILRPTLPTRPWWQPRIGY